MLDANSFPPERSNGWSYLTAARRHGGGEACTAWAAAKREMARAVLNCIGAVVRGLVKWITGGDVERFVDARVKGRTNE